MNIVYAREHVAKSIFLAGPTPRDPFTPSWRPEAIKILYDLGFKGNVYVPEHRDGAPENFDYDSQVYWEWEALAASTVILFWVPRDLKVMPGMVTNVEFGFWIASGKVVLGAPHDAPKMGYLKALAKRHNVKVFDDLELTCWDAIDKTTAPYL